MCKILYTLCKIRGPKVVSRLLNNEAEILEPILDKLEAAVLPLQSGDSLDFKAAVTWEEKYCLMLWISHLLFAPFDLSTIGSSRPATRPVPSSLQLPHDLPSLVVRLVSVSVMHIASSGKERESAVKLLSRLAARPDMLRLGLHSSLIEWSLLSLTSLASTEEQHHTPYESIGYLSLLSALSSAMDAITLEPFLLRIFNDVLALASDTSSLPSPITSSAVARKSVIKLLRGLSLAALQLSEAESSAASVSDQILGDAIDYLLTSLADNDTPVRQSASKAISVITAKLPVEMATEIVEAVVSSLEENVLWIDRPESQASSDGRPSASRRSKCRDLSAINPLRWHGLVLTLSQLLFQRSAPSSRLHVVLNALLLALQFEKRATSGSSLGSNVRDAANFGVWSIARKYSTKELMQVKPPAVETNLSYQESAPSSTIQIVASELVVAACLDISGNIRRGSSAALQELIGRHPDTIAQGISLVQTVDYHAVALRSRAVCDVALAAAKLDRFYWDRLSDALFGWRGLCAADATARRLAADALAVLSNAYGPKSFVVLVTALHHSINSLHKRDVESRHGLFLAAAGFARNSKTDDGTTPSLSDMWDVLESNSVFQEKDLLSGTTRPELTAEAVCAVISSFLRASSPGIDVMVLPSSGILEACNRYVNVALQRREAIVIQSASRAAAELFRHGGTESRRGLISTWTHLVLSHVENGGGTGSCSGYLAALSGVYLLDGKEGEESLHQSIRDTFVEVLRQGSHADIDTRVEGLKGLKDGIIIKMESTLGTELIDILATSLHDYTIDQRGDIGSLARIEAIYAVGKAMDNGLLDDSAQCKALVALVSTLSVEKLDRVRFAAWGCLCACHSILSPVTLTASAFETVGQTCSAQYYSELLRLLALGWLRRSILQGLVLSTGSGSEAVLRASRLALSQYCNDTSDGDLQDLATTLLSLLRDKLNEDRLVVPLLETWAYLFQAHHALHLQQTTEFSFRQLFVLVQKAHFKSGNAQKLTAALEVYAGLGVIEVVRKDVLRKTESLLFHPLPKVRNHAADILYRLTGMEKLLPVDWSKAPKELKKVWAAA